MHELVQAHFNSISFFNLLLLVEAGQFLWFTVHPDFLFLWQTSLGNYPRELVRYTQVDSFLKNGDKGWFFASLYISLAALLVILIGIIIVLVKLEESKKKSSTVVYYTVRILSFCALLLITIAPMPAFQIFLQALICQEGDLMRGTDICYQGIHLVNTIVAAIGMVFFLICVIFIHLLYNDFNPTSRIPFARAQSRLVMIKLAFKFLIALYATIDYNFDLVNPFLIVYSVLWLGILVLRYRSQGYYSKSVTAFAITTECIIFWSSFCTVIQAYLNNIDGDDIGLYYTAVICPFAAYTGNTIYNYQRFGTMKMNIKKCKKPRGIEEYLNVATFLVEKKEYAKERIFLEGLIKRHANFCKKKVEDCLCNKLITSISKNDESLEDNSLWYSFFQSVLADAIIKFPKNPRLHLLHSYYLHDRMENRYKALYELMIAEEHKPNMEEEFSIFRFKNIIEKEIKETDIRNADTKSLDMNMIVHFQQKFVAFQVEIGKSVQMQLDFWRELEQTNPNVQRLLYIGTEITLQADVVGKAYSILTEINPNHAGMLKVYGNFLNDIMNDSAEAQRILEKADYFSKSAGIERTFIEGEKFKYTENGQSCIITLSGNLRTLGNVVDATYDVANIVEYTHVDIIGENIKMIIPDVIGNIHNDLLLRYFETSNSETVGRERLVIARNKSGYLVPCHLMVKIYPDLEEGLRIIGFLRKIENHSFNRVKDLFKEEKPQSNAKTHYVMYGGEYDTVYGVTESCYQDFGIPASLTNGDYSDFTIDHIFPNIHQRDIEDLKAHSGVICTLDTTLLPDNFLLEPESEPVVTQPRGSVLERIGFSKFRTAQVRIVLVEESFYLEKVHVKLIKFTEIAEENYKNFSSDAVQIEELRKKKMNEDFQETNTDDEETSSNDSGHSLGSSVGEDGRQLKDMKAKINEKNTPSSVFFLRTVCLALTLALVAITSTQYANRGDFDQELKYGLNVTLASYLRHEFMSDINFYGRYLDEIGRELIENMPSTHEEEVKARMRLFVTYLNGAQLAVSEARMAQNLTSGKGTYTLSYVPVLSQMADGTIGNTSVQINQAYYLYLGHAQRLLSIDTDDYYGIGPDLTNAQLSLYYLITNGLGILRTKSEGVSDFYTNYYLDRTNEFSNFHLTTVIIAVSFIVLTLLIVIPKIFSVNSINMKVLSLFGFISPKEIQQLAEKCEDYIANNLDEVALQKEESYFESEDDEHQQLTQPEKSEVNLKEIKRRLSRMGGPVDESGHQDFTMQMKEFSESEDLPKMRVLTPQASHRNSTRDYPLTIEGTQRTMTAREDRPFLFKDNPMFKTTEQAQSSSIDRRKGPVAMPGEESKIEKQKSRQKEEEEEDLEEYFALRSKRLRNSKNHKKHLVILQTSILATLLVGFFVGDYIAERILLNDYKKILKHLTDISSRVPNLKYIHTYTQEELQEADLTKVYPTANVNQITTNNTRTQYAEKIYTNQQSIGQALIEEFPNAFDEYFTILKEYSYGDLCTTNYFNTTDLQAYCKTLASGVLTRGLVQAEIAYIDSSNKIIQKRNEQPVMDEQAMKDLLNDPDLAIAELVVLILGAIEKQLTQSFMAAGHDYIDFAFSFERVRFAGFICALFVIMCLVVLPFLNKLTRQIFRTKALLNMISMEMLKQNKSLKEIFTSDVINRALR